MAWIIIVRTLCSDLFFEFARETGNSWLSFGRYVLIDHWCNTGGVDAGKAKSPIILILEAIKRCSRSKKWKNTLISICIGADLANNLCSVWPFDAHKSPEYLSRYSLWRNCTLKSFKAFGETRGTQDKTWTGKRSHDWLAGLHTINSCAECKLVSVSFLCTANRFISHMKTMSLILPSLLFIGLNNSFSKVCKLYKGWPKY